MIGGTLDNISLLFLAISGRLFRSLFPMLIDLLAFISSSAASLLARYTDTLLLEILEINRMLLGEVTSANALMYSLIETPSIESTTTANSFAGKISFLAALA